MRWVRSSSDTYQCVWSSTLPAWWECSCACPPHHLKNKMICFNYSNHISQYETRHCLSCLWNSIFITLNNCPYWNLCRTINQHSWYIRVCK
jgi:hypothetical protein